jgi:hypothetical protein
MLSGSVRHAVNSKMKEACKREDIKGKKEARFVLLGGVVWRRADTSGDLLVGVCLSWGS